MEETYMEELKEILNESNYGHLATTEEGSPRVRPFGFGFEEEGKYFFCTNNKKDVYQQLKKNPYAEYSVTSKNMITFRIRGNVQFVKDLSKKEEIIESSSLLKSIYKSAGNPIFEVFYIEPEKIIRSTMDGQPPQIYNFTHKVETE